VLRPVYGQMQSTIRCIKSTGIATEPYELSVPSLFAGETEVEGAAMASATLGNAVNGEGVTDGALLSRDGGVRHAASDAVGPSLAGAGTTDGEVVCGVSVLIGLVGTGDAEAAVDADDRPASSDSTCVRKACVPAPGV